MENQQAQAKNNYAVPIAIVVAGALIALALFYSNNSSRPVQVVQPGAPSRAQVADTTDKVRPIDSSDHVRGAKNAKVTVIEYSDFECPFCKRFHPVMQDILKEEDDVAWVYRQFPLDSLHPKNGRRASVAAECVGKLGGGDAFWTFTDGYFRETPSNDRTDFATVVPKLVAEAGVDQEAFDACVASGEMDKHVQDDVDNAIATGGQGTPWSIVITASGKTLPLNGAQPKESVKQLIEFARNN